MLAKIDIKFFTHSECRCFVRNFGSIKISSYINVEIMKTVKTQKPEADSSHTERPVRTVLTPQ